MEYLDFIDKIRGKREKNTFERAENTLTDIENYMLGTYYRSFKNKEISYQELEEYINELLFKVEPILEKPTIYKKEELISFNERKQTNNLLPRDIRGLLISNKTHQNIIFYYDKPIIKIMAEYQDEQAISAMQELTKIERQQSTYYRKIGKTKNYK